LPDRDDLGDPGGQSGGRVRRPTVTAAFGSSRRESHDASGFYRRFVAPEIADDEGVARPTEVDVIYRHDARDMAKVASNSVALVVTSPPYFAGKEYEECLGQGVVPATYFEYLALLRDVFAECRRVLEPGGRIAVNVANLGRRPYRSLAGDVTDIFQQLGLLLRGEVVWWKGRAAGGSCAWGSFQSPTNPVLRDITERIVIASKGRFDRAIKPGVRYKDHLPSTATISRDEFLEATTDLWEIPPERASRVGHPAPFPVALPTRLMDLYTYEGDVILDPFMGSGTSAVAALRSQRHFIGFETDESYVARARARVDEEHVGQQRFVGFESTSTRVQLPPAAEAGSASSVDGDEPQGQAIRQGLRIKDLAAIVLAHCGFAGIQPGVKVVGTGIELSFVATDQVGGQWAFNVSGALTVTVSGLRRSETLWKALGQAAVLNRADQRLPLVLLTTAAPAAGTAGAAALALMTGPGRPVRDCVELLDADGQRRLRHYAYKGKS